MSDVLTAILCATASFAVGSIPFGLLVGRWVGGVDVRTIGSGNVGATNVSRALGGKWFFVVLLLDAAKGAGPVLLVPLVAGDASSDWLRVGCGMAAVLGHIFSPFLGFKGGKGVATGAGVFAALAPVPALCAVGIFGLVLAVSRFMSLASMVAAASLGPMALVFREPVPEVVFGAVVAAVVISRHRANLARIAAGTEPRVFRKKESAGG